MIDPLLARAFIAIEESHSLQQRRCWPSSKRTRSASCDAPCWKAPAPESEIKAYREDKK